MIRHIILLPAYVTGACFVAALFVVGMVGAFLVEDL